jgi:transposase
MEPAFEHGARLVALESALPPEEWEARAQEAAIMKVRGLQASEGFSEPAALAQVAPGLHRSTFRYQVSRYTRGGVAGHPDHTPPPPSKVSKVTPEARAIVCALRQVAPHIDVERIGQVVEHRAGVTLSESVIRRVLVAEGLNRPRGGGSGRSETAIKQVEDVLFGGAAFLAIMDDATGYSREMAETIAEAARAVAAARRAARSAASWAAGRASVLRGAVGRCTALAYPRPRPLTPCAGSGSGTSSSSPAGP